MSRGWLKTGLVLGVIYLGIHLALGSSPVQRRVLGELKRALLEFGIELQIESIEFSAFSPKLYLNRVTMRTTPKAEVQLEFPLEVDKIKVQFQPLALISRTIVIDEASLFHPKILVPRAEELYKKIVEKVNSRKRLVVKGPGWPVDFRRLGIVDAEFEVASQNPSFAIRSRSLTIFGSQSAQGQGTLEVDSPHIEIDRGPLKMVLTRLSLDLDATEKSVRINNLVLASQDADLKWKGAFSLPIKSKGPDSFHLSHETNLDLSLLKKIPELHVSELSGRLKSQGTIHAGAGLYSGTGRLEAGDIRYAGYQFGNPAFVYSLNDKQASLTNVRIEYAGGEVLSDLVTVDFTNRFPLKANLELKRVELDKLLASLKSEEAPVKMLTSGQVRVAGFLGGPLALAADTELSFQDLWVISEPNLPLTRKDQVLHVAKGKLKGNLNINPQQLSFVTTLDVLQGKTTAEGKLRFENSDLDLHIDAKGLSLTELGSIADIEFGGKADIIASLDVHDGGGKILGQLEVKEGNIAGLEVGTVKGNAQYSRGLLSFSNLELKAMETVRGNGFVDFVPKRTKYRFDIDARRLTMEQMLAIFVKTPLPFESPKGGEVGTRVVLEGGDDDRGIQVTANGQARAFRWYGESWMSANFGFTYRPGLVRVHRGVLLKRSGSLEARAEYSDKVKRLTLFTSGMRLEELNFLGSAPLQGKVEGRWDIEGDFPLPRGNGNLQFSKVSFRGSPIPDSAVAIRTTKGTTQYDVKIAQDRLAGSLIRHELERDQEKSEFRLAFRDFDFAPYLALWLGKDLPPVRELRVSGTVDLNGDFRRPDSWDGTGAVNSLFLGLKGNPMRGEPAKFEVHRGAISIPKLRLAGSDSQIVGKFALVPGSSVQASLDAKLDLQYLQPFIPAVDYGAGRVSLGIQVSGKPEKFEMIGNASLEDGVFRLTGLADEFRATQAQVSISQDRMTIEKFQASLGGGEVTLNGEIRIDRFQKFAPALNMYASKVTLRTGSFLSSRVSGDFSLKGETTPYLLAGRCQVEQVKLTSFNASFAPSGEEKASLRFDIKGEANDQILVQTDVMDAEFKGDFNLLGDTNQVGLLGSVEAIRGSLIFKDTKFALESGVAKFEDPKRINPRFNVSGRTVVREQKGAVSQDYEVNLQVLGTPNDYKIRLSSTPPLSEPDLISLLVLGVTNRNQESNYLDLGSTIVGQTPFQSKIQDELGFDIKVGTAQGQPNTSNANNVGAADTASTVPSVRIEKGISKKTKLSYSNTLDDNPVREFKIEQMLNDNFTVNATASDRGRTTTQTTRPGDSFGLDFRYRFNFE